MREYLPVMIVGLLVSVFSIPNLMGKVASYERCRRQGIREENMPAYSRIMGVGTLIMGISIIITAALLMIFQVKVVYLLAAVGCVLGVGVIVYGQTKYRDRMS